MKLKIIIVPLAVFIAIWLTIWQVVPLYNQSQLNKQTLKQKETELETAKKKNSNAVSLRNYFQDESENTNFLNGYIAAKSDEEYLIDTITDVAFKEGVLITQVELSAPMKKENADGSSDQSSMSAGAENTAGTAPGSISGISSKKLPWSFTLKTDGSGKYEDIKAFLGSVSRLVRYVDFISVKISRQDEDNIEKITSGKPMEIEGVTVNPTSGNVNNEEGPSGGDVNLNVSATFSFNFLEKPNNSILNSNNPVFNDSKFKNIEVIDEIKNMMNTRLNDLNIQDIGKNNPFFWDPNATSNLINDSTYVSTESSNIPESSPANENSENNTNIENNGNVQ